MKKNMGVLIITLIVVILIIGSLVVYAKTNNKQPTIQDKVSDEIRYLDNYIISLLGHFNGISVGDEIFQTSQPKTQLGKQETNPQNDKDQNKTEEQNNQSQGESNNQNEENSGNQGNSQAGATNQNQSNTQKTSSDVTKNGILANKRKL